IGSLPKGLKQCEQNPRLWVGAAQELDKTCPIRFEAIFWLRIVFEKMAEDHVLQPLLTKRPHSV
ncbi:MAG TPA: hypothetical protein VM492_11870, partial [Sumerlaeia bacterium]|nr:hypothetical protein [Sumerlaeia bacterium]